MVTVRTIESLLVLSSIEAAGTNLYRTAVVNSASGKIVAAARETARDLIYMAIFRYNSKLDMLKSWFKSCKVLKSYEGLLY